MDGNMWGCCVVKPGRLAFAALLAALCGASPAQENGAPPKEIRIQAKKNPGDLSYPTFYDLQQRLIGYLPPEPRIFDAVNRISFTHLSLPEQDAYAPPGWAVSIVGDALDETVPMRRGGYFLLPYLLDAYKEKATVMFREQSTRNYVETAWIVRIGESRRLTYAEFGKAMEQLRAVQKAIPLRYILNYRIEKFASYDGLKACFNEPGGALLVDGQPAADAVSGNCAVLRFDPSRAGSAQVIEFKGALDIVTLIDTGPYLRAKVASASIPQPAG
jgi:hypothetical protein